MNLMFSGNVTLIEYLAFSLAVFMVGMCGVFINRKSVITVLMSIELMLLGVNISFVGFSTMLNDYLGQVFTVFILTVAAAEAAIGLAILVVYFKNKDSIDISIVRKMKG